MLFDSEISWRRDMRNPRPGSTISKWYAPFFQNIWVNLSFQMFDSVRISEIFSALWGIYTRTVVVRVQSYLAIILFIYFFPR